MHFKKILSIFLAAVLTLSMLTVFAVGTEETEIFQVEVEVKPPPPPFLLHRSFTGPVRRLRLRSEPVKIQASRR